MKEIKLKTNFRANWSKIDAKRLSELIKSIKKTVISMETELYSYSIIKQKAQIGKYLNKFSMFAGFACINNLVLWIFLFERKKTPTILFSVF